MQFARRQLCMNFVAQVAEPAVSPTASRRAQEFRTASNGRAFAGWQPAKRQTRQSALRFSRAVGGFEKNQKHPATQAFTLIELMVVLVLIGIMTAMIIPEMRGSYEDALLRATGRRLVSVLNLAYSRAVTASQLHRVRIDRKSGHYSIERTARDEESGRGFVPVRDIPGGEGDLDTRISIEIRRPNEEASAERNSEEPDVAKEDSANPSSGDILAFYPDGTADAKEIQLRDREGFRLALRINPATARVRIVELERQSTP